MGLERIFKAYDVRGVYPTEIDADAAYAIGWAFATFASERGETPEAVLVGRDMRESSVPLSEAFVRGVTQAGLDVVDLGLVSTDLVYFASGARGQPGAMFTASHNPAEYNGIKMCLAGAAPVGIETGLARILELAQGGVRPAARTGSVTARDELPAFRDHLLGLVRVGSLRPLTVVADAANGMGGKVVPAVLEGLPIRLVGLYFDLDGTFPNHPADPIQPANIVDLQATVRREGADVGLAFDGDADRVFLTDERAEPVSGSLTTALVAQRLLERHPGES